MIEKTGIIGGLNLPEKAEYRRERDQRLWTGRSQSWKINSISDARHRGCKPRRALHCRVLPPGEFNCVILEPLSIYYEGRMMIPVAMVPSCCNGNKHYTGWHIKSGPFRFVAYKVCITYMLTISITYVQYLKHARNIFNMFTVEFTLSCCNNWSYQSFLKLSSCPISHIRRT